LVENQDFHTILAFDAPLGVPIRILSTFGVEKPEMYGYPTATSFSRFNTIGLLACDGRTDGQTSCDNHSSRYAASREKDDEYVDI